MLEEIRGDIQQRRVRKEISGEAGEEIRRKVRSGGNSPERSLGGPEWR